MKKISCLIVLALSFAISAIAQESIKLLPFVGKDKSEVILAFNTKTGKSMEWYYDEGLKKMNKASAGWQLPSSTGVSGNVNIEAYIDADGSEVLLVWNPATGQSVSWYYDEANKKMMRSKPEYQLPENIGLTGNIIMKPYVGADNSEVILCWDTKSGKSIEYYFDKTLKKFKKADDKFQLPSNLGLTGNVMMHPYIGNDGSEITLVWDKPSGKSVAWYLNNAQHKYILAEPNFQLPSSPAITGNVMMYPYVGSDGSEIIQTWNVNTGQSVSYFYDNATKKFIKSQANYQLPANLGVGGNYMICPVISKGDEVIYVWNASTGKSINYYFDKTLNKYNKSEDKWQLPAKILE